MSDSGEETNNHWAFVKSGEYYNIDSESFGILRAPGSGFDNGNKPYFVVSTNKASPATDADKTWTIYYNEGDNTYRFESRTAGRFLYHNEDGTVTHSTATANDDRSNWELILIDNSLSISDAELQSSSINLYPNPADNQFTIRFKNLEKPNVKIYDILGKVVYENISNGNNIQVNTGSSFTSGIYLVRVISAENKVFHKKIVIK